MKGKIHLVGIGGAGMRSLALLLHQKGYQVQGSDLLSSPTLEKLQSLGIKTYTGHSKEIISNDVREVVYSSAINAHNPEIVEAKRRKIPLFSRGEKLSLLVKEKKEIIIAGTHGKTTTSAILAFLLKKLKLSHSYYLGGEIDSLGFSAEWGEGEYIVCESDESDKSFLLLHPFISILTNIDNDHLDRYEKIENLWQDFYTFASKTASGGLIMGNIHCPGVKKLLSSLSKSYPVLTYGGKEAELRVEQVKFYPFSTHFTLSLNHKKIGRVDLPLPGYHNVLNALPGIYLSHFLGADWREIFQKIQDFSGVKRRYEVKGKSGKILIIDDYAHHPSEIQVTIRTARLLKKKLIVVFQPHRFSRTKLLAKEMAYSLLGADEVILLPIYSAGEKPLPGVSSQQIYQILLKQGKKCHLMETQEEVLTYLKSISDSPAVVITMGAGDVYQIGERLVSEK